jgi:RimJ/RimL family protein N-acetyltransferase
MHITLRKVTPEDSAKLLQWRNEATTIPWMGQTRPLTQEEHDDWFAGALLDDQMLFLIIEVDGIAAGQIRYQRSEKYENPKAAKVSINIAQQFHGKGIATQAFSLGSALIRATGFASGVFANVLPNNFGSIGAMKNAGFTVVKQVNVNGREHLMMTDMGVSE